MTDILAKDVRSDDRRRVLNAGAQLGRDAVLQNFRSGAELGVVHSSSTNIANRGERLVLTRARFERSDEHNEPFQAEVLHMVQIDGGERITAILTFDFDDFASAISELDARHLAGEAAAHAHTWSMVAESYAALSREEFPAVSPDSVFVDHRRAAAFGSTDLSDYIRAGWELGQHIRPYIEAVHRLSDLGAVCSYAAQGVSDQGFDAEWQGVNLSTVEGDTFNYCEFFDAPDLDAALARFDELSRRPARRLENAASRVADRFSAHLAAGEWDAIEEILADDFTNDDRRRVVGSGILNKDAQIANTHAIAELWSDDVTFSTIATRGERLVLIRLGMSNTDQGSEAFSTEVLGILEISSRDRMTAFVTLDPDDFDAAIAELDRRFVVGEGALHSHTWSAITRGNTAANRQEPLPTTPDCVTVDHRLRATLDADGLGAYLRESWGLTPDLQMFIESVHRLSDSGSIVTHASRGTSRDDFDAEWRQITLFMIEGDLLSRCEIFDETNLDAALARFDELSQPKPRLENTATRVFDRMYSCVAAGDWHTVTQISAENVCVDDRRRVVNAGVLHGRDANIEDAKATVDVGFTMTMLDVLATRGERLAADRSSCVGPRSRGDCKRCLGNHRDRRRGESRGCCGVRPRRLRLRHNGTRPPIPCWGSGWAPRNVVSYDKRLRRL